MQDLRLYGVSHWRLQARDIGRPLRGVATTRGADPADFEVRIAAARTLLREGQFISRRSAARLLGAPIDLGGTLDIGAIRPTKPPRRALISGHQVSRKVLFAIPTAPTWLPTAADVWALLAPVSTPIQLVMVGDYLVSGASRRERPLCTIADLEEAVARFRGCTGTPRLASALRWVRTGVESPAETRLRLLIVDSGLPEPQTSCPIPVAGRVLRADLGYPMLRIAIEYDGSYHFESGIDQARRDIERAEMMTDAGWRVLRLTALDLRQPARFLDRLERAVSAAGGRPNPMPNPRTFIR